MMESHKNRKNIKKSELIRKYAFTSESIELDIIYNGLKKDFPLFIYLYKRVEGLNKQCVT